MFSSNSQMSQLTENELTRAKITLFLSWHISTSESLKCAVCDFALTVI